MSKQIAASLFIPSPYVAKSAELYQVLRRGMASYQQSGNHLIQLAEQAHAFRQFDQVKAYGQSLTGIPIKKYQAAGQYYLAVATNRRGNGNQDQAHKLFEQVAETAPDPYKAKALLSLAAVSAHLGDRQSEFRYLVQSAEASKDVSTTVKAQLGIAIYKSIEGFHKQSLNDLKNLYAIARQARPVVFFDYLNSLAVELGEVGRLEAARRIMRRVLASPFAFAYPEWRETGNEIRLKSYKSRSTVSLTQPITPNNLLHLPERAASEPFARPPFQQPGSVTRLEDWKRKMVKESDGNDTDQLPDDMTSQDMAMKLLELITENRTDEERLRKILGFALKVFAEPDLPE